VRNAICLLSTISYFSNVTPTAGKTILKRFKEINYDRFLKAGFNNNRKLVFTHAHVFMSNILDYSCHQIYWSELDKNYIMPSHDKLSELFLLENTTHSFNVVILTAKKMIETIEFVSSNNVSDLTDVLKQNSRIFNSSELEPGFYSLFLEIDRRDIDDIAIPFEWTIQSLKHFTEYVSSIFPYDMHRLCFRRRLYSIKDLIGAEKLTNLRIESMFLIHSRRFLKKSSFHKYCTTQQLVKLGALLAALDEIENEKDGDLSSARLLIKNCLPEEDILELGENEWGRRIRSYLENNAYLKDQHPYFIKQQFLEIIGRSKTFCSSVYSATFKSTQKDIEVSLVLSIAGIYIYKKWDYSTPISVIFIHEILSYSSPSTNLKELNLQVSDRAKNSILRISLCLERRREFVEDVFSYVLISLRQDKKLFYAYIYTAENEQVKDNEINKDIIYNLKKCRHVINQLYETGVKSEDLPFNKSFFDGVLECYPPSENEKESKKYSDSEFSVGGDDETIDASNMFMNSKQVFQEATKKLEQSLTYAKQTLSTLRDDLTSDQNMGYKGNATSGFSYRNSRSSILYGQNTVGKGRSNTNIIDKTALIKVSEPIGEEDTERDRSKSSDEMSLSPENESRLQQSNAIEENAGSMGFDAILLAAQAKFPMKRK